MKKTVLSCGEGETTSMHIDRPVCPAFLFGNPTVIWSLLCIGSMSINVRDQCVWSPLSTHVVDVWPQRLSVIQADGSIFWRRLLDSYYDQTVGHDVNVLTHSIPVRFHYNLFTGMVDRRNSFILRHHEICTIMFTIQGRQITNKLHRRYAIDRKLPRRRPCIRNGIM